MNLFTVIQVVLIAALLGLKFSPAGMFYPLAIVLLVPLRKFLGKYVFSHVELEAVSLINKKLNICNDNIILCVA